MRRRPKKLRPGDGTDGPSTAVLSRFDWREWLSDEEKARAPMTEAGWEDLSNLAWRRWMDARSDWAQQRGLRSDAAYELLEAERRRLASRGQEAVR